MAADVPAKDMKIDLQPTGLTFTGPSGSKKATYHVQLDFFAEVDPAASKITHSARDVAMKLQKKDLKEEYWPRLLKESKKMHFLKTDFDKVRLHPYAVTGAPSWSASARWQRRR